MAQQRQVEVTGADNAWPEYIPCRLPIKELRNNELQWSLYIQALRSLQNKQWDSPDQLSYWQIASIHGKPYTVDAEDTIPYKWDTVPKPTNKARPRNWCAHSRSTFPTWHRPYVALYEQALVNAAIDIVKKYPSPLHPQWIQAAESLRAPYWDWAVDVYPPKEVIQYPEVRILDLDGQHKTGPNPLYSFKYPTGKGTLPIEDSTKTVRQPPSATGETDVQEVRKQLRIRIIPKGSYSMRERMYLLHTQMDDWEEVSNEGGTPDNMKFRNGLEQAHNAIHIGLGGMGAMGHIPTAGFDPAFMLHHAQVDRQLALWQTINYDKWIPDGPEASGKDLTPFWDGKHEFKSSGPVKNFRQFQYRYPEFVGIPDDDAGARQFMLDKVEELYGTPPAPEPVPPRSLAAAAATPALDWFAHVRIPRKSIQDSLTVFFFLGSVPENPRDWSDADNLVGTYDKFGGSDPANCANCQDLIAEGVESHAVVSLTPTLKLAEKYDQSEKEVEQYLADKLKWGILKTDRTTIDPGELGGFTIRAFTLELTRPRGGHMPMFPAPNTAPVFHDAITDGKPGGHPRS